MTVVRTSAGRQIGNLRVGVGAVLVMRIVADRIEKILLTSKSLDQGCRIVDLRIQIRKNLIRGHLGHGRPIQRFHTRHGNVGRISRRLGTRFSGLRVRIDNLVERALDILRDKRGIARGRGVR